jgi:hypothetical protein
MRPKGCRTLISPPGWTARPTALRGEEPGFGRSDWMGLRIKRGRVGRVVFPPVLAVPGLDGIERTVAHMQGWWIAAAVAPEVLSCLAYVLAFLQVFERAPTDSARVSPLAWIHRITA